MYDVHVYCDFYYDSDLGLLAHTNKLNCFSALLIFWFLFFFPFFPSYCASQLLHAITQ